MVQITLIRHAQSDANIGIKLPHLHGDYDIALSEQGRLQAAALNEFVSREMLESSDIYCSPFRRTRETLHLLLSTHGLDDLPVLEDPLLREQDRGYETEKSQLALRKVHGWFWYRHAGGESPADVYQRMCVFLDSLFRQLQRSNKKRVVIVTHGMTLRCFVMRYLHLGVTEFERMKNPGNCDLICIGPADEIENPNLVRNNKAVTGLRMRDRSQSSSARCVW